MASNPEMRGSSGCHAFFSVIECGLFSASLFKVRCAVVFGIAFANLPGEVKFAWRFTAVRSVTTLVFFSLLLVATAAAQSTTAGPGAEQSIQQSQSSAPDSNAIRPTSEFRIPAGTPIEVEVAYTVNSLDMKPGERISFRVLVPIVIDGVILVEKDALVTARITQAKRGGHWGKAGKLSWSMEDVIAADNSRVLLAPECASRNEPLWSLENKSSKGNETARSLGSVKGTSHSGEVATRAILSGALFPPLALLHGFRRGENAVLREGRRFIVLVDRDATVKTGTAITTRTTEQ